MGFLEKLKDLDISDNRGIKNLPSTMSQLHDLSKLDISRTGFPKLPTSIGNLNHLKEFTCRDLLLADKRLDLKVLESLEKLDVRDLGLEKFPETCTLSKIAFLNAKNNSLVEAEIPIVISKWKDCVYLNLAYGINL